jgi:hypothetical protein
MEDFRRSDAFYLDGGKQMSPPLRRIFPAVGAIITVAVIGTAARPAWSATGRAVLGTHAQAGSDPALQEIESMVQAATPDRPAAGGRGGGGADPCQYLPGGLVTALDRAPRQTERVDADGVRAVLYARVCGTQTSWYWVRPAASPRQLAQVAMDAARGRLPLPVGVFSPDVQAGRMVIVHVPLRFGVREWAPVSASASVPGVTATVTARPERLEFVPGNGSPPVVCPGPGPGVGVGAVVSGMGGGSPVCTYTYRDASTVAPDGKAWPAQLRISWAVSWTATTGGGGVLPALTTAAGYAVPVGEVQALEQPG